MQRRFLLVAALADPLTPAYAQHGWSGFDQDRPLYLKGTARKVAWRNPHAEFDIELPADLGLPPDLPRRSVAGAVDGRRQRAAARQRAPADAQGPRLAHRARAADAHGTVEVSEIRNGDPIEVLGYTTTGKKGDQVLCAEYLFAGGHAHGLRSSPA